MRDVDLVIYKDGERKVVGQACIHGGGKITGQITVGDEVLLTEVLEAGVVFGTSLGPFRI